MTRRTSGIARSLVLALLFLAGNGGPAPAQGPSPQFLQFVQGKPNRDAVEQAVRGQIAGWPGGCSQVAVSPKFDLIVLQRPEVAADGRSLLAGVWKEAVEATACGVTRVHNILNVVEKGEIHRLPMLVGTSHADIMLQRDAAPLFFMGASRLVAQDCKRNYVTDTRFVALQGPEIPKAKAGPKSRAWREEWTLWSCGKEIVVPIRFTPDATGTAISVLHVEVRQK